MDNKHDQQSSLNNRRSFLKKASAGVVIASLPAKSVWANGLTASVLASGAGSRYGEETEIALQSPGRFKNKPEYSVERDYNFSEVFGGNPIDGLQSTFSTDYTLGEILNRPGDTTGKLGGPSNVNYMLVGMFLNALYSGENEPDLDSGIYYPVVGSSGSGRPFLSYSLMDGGAAPCYATTIYNMALQNPSKVGADLGWLIDQYHA